MKKIRPDGSTEFPAELNAIVLMLVAPTELSSAWMKQDSQGVSSQLTELGFSDEARRFVVEEAIPRLSRAVVRTIREEVKNVFWSGEEPHPSPLAARQIVERIKGLPPEVVPPRSNKKE